MKKTWIIILLLAVCLSISANAEETPFSWQSVIRADGQDIGGVTASQVIIGVEREAATLPSPPAPPEYSVNMVLFDSNWSSMYRDIRSTGMSRHLWIIGIDPHGNMGDPFVQRTARLSWDSATFGDGKFMLLEGYDGAGRAVVEDMKATSFYDVIGKRIKHFSIVYEP
ncbi:MAG: hypothetical protein SRB1_02527 [Desulfobacteraceae bacterium Eth-SRB1]|nr:MAG: hypothetical protein SRB1_02527 [Desulfobacteraceae bacterium Eth-SRB1]